MNADDHVQVGGDRVSFVANEAFIQAADAAAAELGFTRSHFIRQRIAEYLRNEGYLLQDAPTSKYEARFRNRQH